METPACTVTRATFGDLPDGRPVEKVILTAGASISVTVINLGAAVQAVLVPDSRGDPLDVVLGHATLPEYLAGAEYFGATVGRVANRVASGRFSLDGVEYQTPVNDGSNALHGGIAGFDKALWRVVEISEGEEARVALRHISPDGDQGYPGALTVTAIYSLNRRGELGIDYHATTSAPTVVNLSNHTYWNMAGEGSEEGAMGQLLTVAADAYLPTRADAVPTGERRRVDGSPFDFRRPAAIGARVRDATDEQIVIGRGYDHCWVVDGAPVTDLRLIASLQDPVSGRRLEVLSDQPGLQVYSGNFLDGRRRGKSGRLYRQGDAVVLEPQMFPDTPNRPEFGSVRLDPGQEYRNRMIFRISTPGEGSGA